MRATGWMASGAVNTVVKVLPAPRRVSKESLLLSTSEIGRVVIGEALGGADVLVHERAVRGVTRT